MTQQTERKRWGINYVGLSRLYLETADYRLCTHPFGPPISSYEDAVGAIFQSWGESERSKAFVKLIVPNIFEDYEIGEIVPIEVISQTEHEDGIILTVKINYNPPYGSMGHMDLEGRDGQWLILIVYPESASRPVF